MRTFSLRIAIHAKFKIANPQWRLHDSGIKCIINTRKKRIILFFFSEKSSIWQKDVVVCRDKR